MYRRLNAGLLGHTLPAVETVEEVERVRVGHGGKFAVRVKRPGGRTVFNLTREQVLIYVAPLVPGEWNVTPMIDDTSRMCYAHLLDGPGGWFLHYSTTPKPCRLLPHLDGCEEKFLTGLAARLYVRGVSDDIGWETITRLVDDYPDHVIEFTAMSSRTAACGPTNVIIWEVRTTTGEYERNSGWAGK
jgi:hypothetical protein